MFPRLPKSYHSYLPRIVGGLVLLSAVSLQAAADSVDLTPAVSTETHQVKVVYEVSGRLFSQSSGAQKPKQHPLKAIGNFLYEERVLDQTTGRSIRYFEQAQSDFQVDGRSNSSQLRDESRWIVVDPNELEDMFVSPAGALSRNELELIEFPGLSSLIERLLPQSEQKLNDTWKHDDTLLALLFNLDAVTVNDVQSELVKLEDETAYMTLKGSLIGTVKGVVTEVKLAGKYNFDVQSALINWVAFSIEEQREIGASTPGLNVKARLRMVRGSVKQPKHLHDQALTAFDLRSGVQGGLLEHVNDEAGYAVLHHRRWHVFSESPTVSVFRCVDDGRMLAQCNMAALPPISKKKPLTMHKFQQDISMALGDSVTQIVDAKKSTNKQGQKVLRVVAAGTVDQAPILWIYYHVTHKDGRRVACVFTMGATDVEQFGGEDLALTSSIRFLDLPADEFADDSTAALDETVR
ncbi:MAG: hypothetical protein GY768_29155 [Planctomycetaceae bacterium]|nr:hypothetical protein [Planctomycetaceae bacterium]